MTEQTQTVSSDKDLNKELIALAHDKGMSIYTNKVFGKFFILPNDIYVVSELYQVTIEQYNRIKTGIEKTVVKTKIEVEIASLVRTNSLFGKVAAPVLNDLSDLVKEVLTDQLKYNRSMNNLAHAHLKQLLSDDLMDNPYFDYVDKETLILKEWVGKFCKLKPIGACAFISDESILYVVPVNLPLVNSLMTTVIANYIPDIFLPEGESFHHIPKPTIASDPNLTWGDRGTTNGWG